MDYRVASEDLVSRIATAVDRTVPMLLARNAQQPGLELARPAVF